MSMMEDSSMSITFLLASIATLIFVNRQNYWEEDDGYDSPDEDEENCIPINVDYTEEEQHDKRMQIYSTLLINMDNSRDIQFEVMPTFNSMLNGSTRRRCYSADDIDALVLIPDKRIRGVFDQALREMVEQRSIDQSTCGDSTGGSCDTYLSWDRLN